MAKKSKMEEQYEKGQQREQQGNYDAALTCYQQEKGLITLLAIAGLYLLKKVKPASDRPCVDVEYIEAAFKILDELIKTKKYMDQLSTQKYRNHPIYSKVEKIITALPNDNAEAYRKYYILAKLELANVGKETRKYLRFMILATAFAPDKLLSEFPQITEKCNKKAELVIILLAESKKFSAEMDNPERLIITLALLNAVKKSEFNKEDLIKASQDPFVRDKEIDQEIESIKDYPYEDLDRHIIDLYKRVIKNPYNNGWYVNAVWYLLTKDKVDSQFVEACITKFNEIGQNELLSLPNTPEVYCLLGKMKESTEQAKALLKIGLSHLPKEHENYNGYSSHYKNILESLGEELELQQYNENLDIKNDNEKHYKEGDSSIELWEKNKSYDCLEKAIYHLKQAASSNHQGAINKLDNLVKNNIPEAMVAQAEILEKTILPSRQKHAWSAIIPKNKKKEDYIRSLYRSARESYEKILISENNADIYRVVALLRYQDKVFEKNWHIARELFAIAFEKKDQLAGYYYAKMCFYGEGGKTDFQKAKQLYSRLAVPDRFQAEYYYLLGEICYLDYLETFEINEDKQEPLKKCIEAYNSATLAGNKEALMSLFILHDFHQEPLATNCLINIYSQYYRKIAVLNEVVFPAFPLDKSKYYLEFCKCLVARENYPQLFEQFPTLSEYIEQANLQMTKDEEEALRLAYQYNEIVKNNLSQPRLPEELKTLVPVLERLSQKAHEVAKFALAKYQLQFYDNPLPLRQIKNTDYREEVVSLLHSYYSKKHVDHYTAILTLITVLCYEYNRHEDENQPGFNSAECQIIVAILINFDERYKNYKIEEFRKELGQRETEKNSYFDEYISDDSDSEAETIYQGSDKHTTADYPRVEDLVKKIIPIAEKQLNALKKLVAIDEKKYNDLAEQIKSLFVSTIKIDLDGIPHDLDTEEELRTINHYSAQGNLEAALKLVSNRYLIAQKRGIHFTTKLWNKPQRSSFWKQLKTEEHPFHNKPIYSAAVYEKAHIKDFSDLSELTQLRLAKVARYIYQRMLLLSQKEPYDQNDKITLPAFLYRYKFQSRNEQIQQLYTNNYDLFHEFLKSAKNAADPIFVSTKNPFVSTGDIQSSHSERYAYGIKPYAGHEHERLRPRYDHTGRALRPHSGAVQLTLQPLSDYAKYDHNHLVSMNVKVNLQIEQLIIHERECSFYSFIEKDRLIFIHRAKYPSFHRAMCPKTFLYLYGINAALYKLFKELLIHTKPHEYKQRLIILLLGEYLSAYQTLYLLRYAYDKANKQKLVLLFRDKYGNFSLKPTFDILPNPPGDDDVYYLRRYDNRSKRSELHPAGRQKVNSNNQRLQQPDVIDLSMSEEMESVPINEQYDGETTDTQELFNLSSKRRREDKQEESIVEDETQQLKKKNKSSDLSSASQKSTHAKLLFSGIGDIPNQEDIEAFPGTEEAIQASLIDAEQIQMQEFYEESGKAIQTPQTHLDKFEKLQEGLEDLQEEGENYHSENEQVEDFDGHTFIK